MRKQRVVLYGLVFCTLLCIPQMGCATSVKNVQNQWKMQVSTITAYPGEHHVVVPVRGEWRSEIFGYIISVDIDMDVLSLDVEATSNLTGCAGEGAEGFGIVPIGNGINVLVSYRSNTIPGLGIPAGEGVLINLVFDVKNDAPLGLSRISFPNQYCSLYLLKTSNDGADDYVIFPTMIDGFINIKHAPIPEITRL